MYMISSPTQLRTTPFTLTHGYLGFVTTGYGCNGVLDKYAVFLPDPISSDTLTKMENNVRAVQTENKLSKPSTPPPIWDSSFTGTYAEYQKAYDVWVANQKSIAMPLTQIWLSKYAIPVLSVDQPFNVNDPDVDTTSGDLCAVYTHHENGCSCGQYGRDVDENTIIKTAPPVTLIKLDSEWAFLTPGHVSQCTAQVLIEDLSFNWEKQEQLRKQRIAELTEQLKKLANKDQVENMAYDDWVLHKKDPSKRYDIESKLQNFENYEVPLDLAADDSSLYLAICDKVEFTTYGWVEKWGTFGRLLTNELPKDIE